MDNKDIQQQKKNYIWNTLGSISNALSSVVLLMVATRCLSSSEAGLFSFSYAMGQQLQIVGAFEVRPYQVTDVEDAFPFGVYFAFRIITTVFMVFIILIFSITSKGCSYDALILCAVALLRVLDTLEDVFHGGFQRYGRLDIAGKSLFARVCITTVVFTVVSAVTKSLLLACCVSFILGLTCLFFLNIKPAKLCFSTGPQFKFDQIMKLFRACLPLFLGSFLFADLVNVPRLGIQECMADEYQTIYSVIFMPALVINLLSGFIFKPMLTSMAEKWVSEGASALADFLLKCILLIAILIVGICLIAYPLAVPVLSWLYALDLSRFKSDLMLLLLGGGLNALSIVLYYVLVTLRQPRYVLIGYLIAAIVSHAVAGGLVSMLGILGAAITYTLAMGLVCLIFSIRVFAVLVTDYKEVK